ncbi:MAG: 16S rRNA (adenine(1518)-N(6)/adenine(1519)-N(6))-dimethyltransferase RsmA [Gammaproteobacteria bacterium]|nr:16S rRNA (adenine(1518)-N(6)/adenine(1519)-N(6))-dimethyltransferase RsmA [Gammaproteobacteria bacterium]MBU1624662.1 16S rRNA (adenine(1518)-N(6)/adenine(1519)-N(6))-dimethyltransferase RsmA [Gammaproteobacteria bacterium]MBU1982506.1 16S rRNA (adenine(1518)-N(6)/adenine(1519)-N(6))-dimethyltransferase RsmA [Gammaproteobacteria bacterium]
MSGHKAKKQFGQNFLVDQNIIADIVRAIRPAADDNMVEIGPGLGAMTRPLMQHLNKLHVVEIDRDIIARLKTDYPQDKIVIHEGDALKFDFATLGTPLRIVGNLPYNISSPLLFHFAKYAEGITDMHFMLQNEVVERMVAEPSTAAFGRLSVMLQYRFYMEKLLDVPPQSFRPAPKVDSAIVRMIPLPAAQITVKDEALYAKVVASAFGQRRKTLRNTLRDYLAEDDFAQLDINPQLRAENLGVAEFTRIANFLNERAVPSP